MPGWRRMTKATCVLIGWAVQPGLTNPVPATAFMTSRHPNAALTIAGQPAAPMPAPTYPVVYESPRKAATGGEIDAATASPTVGVQEVVTGAAVWAGRWVELGSSAALGVR